MKDHYYLLGLIVALPLLLSSVGAAEITREQLCAEISDVVTEAVERGDMSNKEAGVLLANCVASAG